MEILSFETTSVYLLKQNAQEKEVAVDSRAYGHFQKAHVKFLPSIIKF